MSKVRQRASRAAAEEKAVLVKRVYEPASRQDGRRFLVERLWPRGVKKEALEMEAWPKDVAPSTQLRQWFGHEPERWAEFRRRYKEELSENAQSLAPILDAARKGTVTLLYSAHDVERNSAVVLRDYLLKKVRGRKTSRAPSKSAKRAS